MRYLNFIRPRSPVKETHQVSTLLVSYFFVWTCVILLKFLVSVRFRGTLSVCHEQSRIVFVKVKWVTFVYSMQWKICVCLSACC